MPPGPISRFFRYDRLLAQELSRGCASLLDVGCGNNSPVRRLTSAIPQRTGVDAFAPALAESLRLGIHTDGRQVDVLDIGSHFAPRSYDCVLASDVIEHLEKEEGMRLIEAMERIARRKVVIFTPNGFLPQAPYADNPWQAHRSGWEPGEMRARLPGDRRQRMEGLLRRARPPDVAAARSMEIRGDRIARLDGEPAAPRLSAAVRQGPSRYDRTARPGRVS